jgi:hypothetical protein
VLLDAETGSGDVVEVLVQLKLKRALVADSPQVSLYHQDSTDPAGGAVPFFELLHPNELWCAAPADCAGQQLSPSCAFACQAALCACRPETRPLSPRKGKRCARAGLLLTQEGRSGVISIVLRLLV